MLKRGKKSNIIPTLKYIRTTLIHKYYVFRAGLKIKAPVWNLIVHDLSKFSTKEAPHYARHYFGDKSDPIGFAYAWNHHHKHNRHHWEYWITVTGHITTDFPDNEPLPMPEKYIREMVADWFGAARTYTGSWPASREKWGWFRENYHKVRLHDETREKLEKILNEMFENFKD